MYNYEGETMTCEQTIRCKDEECINCNDKKTGKVKCGEFEDTFDLDKAKKNGGKCRTRDGRDARIICTTAKGCGERSIIALVTNSINVEEVLFYVKDGRCYENSENSSGDLINIPETKTMWLNIYLRAENEWMMAWETREQADEHAIKGRIACVKIEYKDGDGL